MTNTTKKKVHNTVEKTTGSTLMDIISEIINSLLQIAQQNIIERVQNSVNETLEQVKQTANQIIQNAIILFAILLLGIIGLIFTVLGLSLWLGEISGFGMWFGFLVVGITVFVITLIIGLLQKNKSL